MLLLFKPDLRKIDRFLEEQAAESFSYEAVGATNDVPPEGFVVDRTRTQVGRGLDDYFAAKQVLCDWRQFDVGWAEVRAASTLPASGALVAILARSVGCWWLNACRVVYVIDDAEGERFGYAYGTLPEHAGCGEERFTVEIDSQERVWYEIYAFSRPNGLLAHVGYPHMRRKQRQFGQQSSQAVRDYVQAQSRSRTRV